MTNNTRSPRLANLPPTTWWSKQWQHRLEQQAETTRVQRAQKYIRAEIATVQQLGPNQITGHIIVQEHPPRKCSIQISPLSEQAQQIIAQQLTDRPGFAYQLANRELPTEIDQILTAYGEPIVPRPDEQIISECECTDAAPPCSHVAAVYMMAGQRFDQNPTLLLKSRGVDTDALDAIIKASAEELRQWGVRQVKPTPPTPGASESDVASTAAEFWADNSSALRAIEIPAAAEPSLSAAPIHRLGPFPGWSSDFPFLTVMESIYHSNANHISALLRHSTH